MLLDTVRKTISEYGLIEKGDKVLCAVSGGADSMCLLDVVLSLKDELALSVYVANVNHLIRGDEAKRDSDFVKRICIENGVELFYREYDVPSVSQEMKVGEEECGRILRYEFFEEISKKLGGTKIATAHNLNDNAETVLFRLVRGSSAQGLTGIKYKRGNIIRPLLDVNRDEIEEYLNSKNLSWCEDSTNSLSLYSRNKLRNCVMPYLEEISAGSQKKIVSAAKLIKEDNDFIKHHTDELVRKCFFENYILVDELKDIHIALKRRIVSVVLEKWGVKEITVDKIDSFIDFLSKDSGKTFDINAAFVAQKSYDKVLLLERTKEKNPPQVLENNKECIGEKWTIKAYISQFPIKEKSNNIAVFDAEKLSFPLTVRYRKEGDRIKQRGMSGSKKINDIFTDEKIEKHLRDTIPIIEKDNEILFICGLRKTSHYCIDVNTKEYLIVEYEKK